MPIAESWKQAADAAAAVHQIRNRLQSIIIEAALLKRTAGAGDPSALARIGALAQDGAAYLELFGELLPKPDLDGSSTLNDARHVLRETEIDAADGVLDLNVGCHPDALEVLLRVLFTKALPFRGFKPRRIALGSRNGHHAEFVVELEPNSAPSTAATVTPWMTAQQMARDIGGSLELHSGDPPVVKLHLPAQR